MLRTRAAWISGEPSPYAEFPILALSPEFAMQPKNPLDWMLSEALDSLTRAERMRQQFGRQEACWEPPIDVLETEIKKSQVYLERAHDREGQAASSAEGLPELRIPAERRTTLARSSGRLTCVAYWMARRWLGVSK